MTNECHHCIAFEHSSEDLFFLEKLKVINKNKFKICNDFSNLSKLSNGKHFDLILSFFQHSDFNKLVNLDKNFSNLLSNISFSHFFLQDLSLKSFKKVKEGEEIENDIIEIIKKLSFSKYVKSRKLYDRTPIFELIK